MDGPVERKKELSSKYLLAGAIKRRQAILFVGAGVSMAVGLPSWKTLSRPSVKGARTRPRGDRRNERRLSDARRVLSTEAGWNGPVKKLARSKLESCDRQGLAIGAAQAHRRARLPSHLYYQL